jgi:hypothetical protein
MTKAALAVSVLLLALSFLFAAPPTQAATTPCLIVTLTGTSGPPPYNDLAGPETLAQYGDDANNCSSVLLQFDAGRSCGCHRSESSRRS